MLSNCVYIGTKPRINIVPKMLVSVMECTMAGEEYCTFCMQDDEKFGEVVKRICKGLESQGYETEVYYLVDGIDDEWTYTYYLKVKWKKKVMEGNKYVQ